MRQRGTANSSIINSPEGSNTEYLINALRPTVKVADTERDGHIGKCSVSKERICQAISRDLHPFSTHFRRAISTIPVKYLLHKRPALASKCNVKSPYHRLHPKSQQVYPLDPLSGAEHSIKRLTKRRRHKRSIPKRTRLRKSYLGRCCQTSLNGFRIFPEHNYFT